MVAVIGASESKRVEKDITLLGGEKAKRACPCNLPTFAFTVCGTVPFSETSETEAYHCRTTAGNMLLDFAICNVANYACP